MAEAMAGDAGLRQLMLFSPYAGEHISYARQKFASPVRALVSRAQACGQARADLEATELPFMVLMLSTAADYAQDVNPRIWRRYLTLLIDGISASRDGITPLPGPPLLPGEMEMIMSQRSPRPH
jgi:transcriptional regulator SbtR-like protein